MSVLEVNNASIRYMTGDFKDIGLKEYVMRRLTHNYSVNEFWADRDISFSLEKGDMLGIIGSNGAGKSTLLKAVAGIMEPTYGNVRREGSIAALLELGSGFDGDLTVRENTYLRGALLGYTRKFMDDTYDSIIEFAELQDFQNRPFKQLSSGMQSRLAFSIASLVRPDILILDEVLSVGDGAFRKKSEEKMKEIIHGGATTILVSHSMDQVREMCNKVLWLHKGKQVAFGENVDEICGKYEKFLSGAIQLPAADTVVEANNNQKIDGESGDVLIMSKGEGRNHINRFAQWGKNVYAELQQDKLGYLFLVAFLCLLAIISAQNWMYLEQHINDDYAGEFLYMRKVWETGNPFSPEYANCTELLASRPWFLYVIFYSLTKNVVISAKMTLVAITILLAVAATYFFRKLDWTYPETLLALVIFFGMGYGIKYNIDEYPVFRYVPAFSLFLIGEMLTFAILRDITHNKRSRLLKIIILLGISVYFGICGIRMLLYLYLPVFLFEVIQYIHGKLKRNNVSIKPVVISSGLLFANIFGVAVYRFVITPYMHYIGQPSTAFSLATFDSLWTDICTETTFLFRAFGIVLDGSFIFSARGLLTVYMCVLLIVLVWGLCELRKENWLTDWEKKILCYLAASAVLFLIFCYFTRYEGFTRYWFATIPLLTIVLTVSLYRYLYRRKDLKVVRSFFCIFVMVGIGLSSVVYYTHQNIDSNGLIQLTEYLKDNGYYRIASTYWNNSSITFLSNEEVEGPLLSDTETIQSYDWITDRTRWTNDDEPITIVLGPEQRETWLDGEKRGYLLSMADKTEEVAGYSLYHYEKNPLAFDLLRFGENAKFNFISLQYQNGAYLREGMIVLPKGAAQYGPYTSIDSGTYDVVIRGENLDAGTFDVVSGIADTLNARTYEMEGLEKSDNEITFSINADSHADGLEIRCVNQTDEEVAIHDITITPRDQKPIWE